MRLNIEIYLPSFAPVLFGLVLFCFAGLAHADSSDKDMPQDRKALDAKAANETQWIETIPIRPKADRSRYRLSDQQMERLREAEGLTPGALIPFQPLPERRSKAADF